MRLITKNLFIIIFSLFILSLDFYVNANPPINFELGVQGLEQVCEYENYRKFLGLKRAYLYDLPVVPKGSVVSDYLLSSDVESIREHLGDSVFCRFDAPANKWYGLPRGQDIKVDDINIMLSKVKKTNPSAVLLCFAEPSQHFLGKIVERPYISGGLSILIDWNKSIVIEYVGQGFDAGDLTRGSNGYHCCIVIPWEVSGWPVEFMWDHLRVQNISSAEYSVSRQHRVDILESMGYSKVELENCIPSAAVPKMDINLFKIIFEKCISKVVKYPGDFDTNHPTVIMANIYGEKIHVVEIWNSNS